MASFVLCHWLTPVRSAELPIDLLATFKQPEDNIHYLKIAVAHATSTVFLAYPPKVYYFIKWKVDHIKINLNISFLCKVSETNFFFFLTRFCKFVSVMLQVFKLYKKLQMLLFNTLTTPIFCHLSMTLEARKNISMDAGSQMPLW